MTIAIFAVAGVVTYLLRSFMLVFGDRLTSSNAAESAIELISPAVLTAIVASALFLEQGEVTAPDLAAVLAVGAAVVAVRRTSNVGMAIAVGLPIYWIASATMAGVGLG